MFSPYAAMGNSPGMMIDPNGELTKDAQPVQDNGMDYAGLDAIAVRAFMDGVMSGLYNINFMFGSNTMVMASGGGSGGVQNVGGREWLPKYTDNMNMCNVFRAALSDVPSDIIGIKGFTISPDNSIYVTYTADVVTWHTFEEGGEQIEGPRSTGNVTRTIRLGFAPRGDLQKLQSNGGNGFWSSIWNTTGNVAENIVSSVTLTVTGIVMPIINQGSVIANEGLHSGSAWHKESEVSWAVPYKFKNWQFIRQDQMMGQTLSWEDGKDVIKSTTQTLFMMTPVKYDFSIPGLHPLIQTGINRGASMGTKIILKKGIYYLVD